MIDFIRSLLGLPPRDEVAEDPVWDAALNEALDNFPVRLRGQHQAMVGPLRVWVQNYPYAYGRRQAGICTDMTGLPSMKTRRRLREAVSGVAFDELKEARDHLNPS